MLSFKENMSEVDFFILTSDLSCIAFFFCERKFYVRTRVKSTRQWKSTLRDEFFKTPYSRNYKGNGYKLSVQRCLG